MLKGNPRKGNQVLSPFNSLFSAAATGRLVEIFSGYARVWDLVGLEVETLILGVPIIRIIVYWGLYLGSLVLGNYNFTVSVAAKCFMVGQGTKKTEPNRQAPCLNHNTSLASSAREMSTPNVGLFEACRPTCKIVVSQNKGTRI